MVQSIRPSFDCCTDILAGLRRCVRYDREEGEQRDDGTAKHGRTSQPADTAYRVETRGVSVMLSSDQNGTDPKFVDFAKNANVLNMHLAIAANAPPSPLHASPALVGRLGQEAGAKKMILGHIGQFDLDAAIADVKKAYTGALTVGSDLQCTPVQ